MIDIHAHTVFESTFGLAGSAGPELLSGNIDSGTDPCFRAGAYRLTGVDYRGTPFMDLERRLEQMDELGIERQVLSPNPLTFFASIEPAQAIAFAAAHNDAMAALCALAPKRVSGFAQLPVQDLDAAIKELDRAVRDLGLVAPYLPTDIGRPLDAPEMDDLWAAAVDVDVPVFFHPSPDGIDRARRDKRLERFDRDLWLGFAYEEAIAVSSIVLGGVLDRHPTLDVCLSHGGGATSWLAERMEHAARTRAWGNPAHAEPGAVRSWLRSIWWDAHVGGPNSLASLIETMGTERLVAGTNMAGWDQSDDPTWGDHATRHKLRRQRKTAVAARPLSATSSLKQAAWMNEGTVSWI